MKSAQLLKELINLVDELESLHAQTNKEVTMSELVALIQSKQIDQQKNDRNNRIHIAHNMALMYRYSKFYIKKALQGTLLQTADEYMYLVELYTVDKLSKTELNNRIVMEKTSGNEIMKRLMSMGLIGECRDTTDKRRTMVFITDKGKDELMRIFPQLWKAANILPQMLTNSERQVFVDLSDKICHAHHDVFVNHREDDINQICKRFDDNENDR